MPIAIMALHFGPGVANSGGIAGGALGIYRNLVSALISDIILGIVCPSDYEMMDLGTWPGTVEFCYDHHWIQTKYQLSCSPKYDAVPSQEYNVWKGTEISVKRITQVSNSSSCPWVYVQCYPGICTFGTDSDITEIHFENSSRTRAGWFSTFFNSIYVNYRKDMGVLPISLFSVVHGDITSYLNAYEYNDLYPSNFPALTLDANGYGRYRSFPNISHLDKASSFSIFENQIWSELVTSLPRFYGYSSSVTGFLTAIPRLELENLSPCLTFNLKTFLDGANDMHTSCKITTGFVITIIIILVFVTIFGAFFSTDRYVREIALRVLRYTVLLNSILTIPAAVLTTILKGDLKTFQQSLSSVTDSKCFVDNSAQQVLTDFMSNLVMITKVTALWEAYAIVSWIGIIVVILNYYAMVRARPSRSNY